MSRNLQNMPARYRALFSDWRNGTASNTYGNTAGWIAGVNTGPERRRRLSARHHPTLSLQPDSSSREWIPTRTVACQVAVRLGRTGRRREHDRHGPRSVPFARTPQNARSADEQPRNDSLSDDPEPQYGSLRPQQDQRRERADPAIRSGFQQTSRFASRTANSSLPSSSAR